jgi:2-dehydro-3-deoxyphosphogluconate aldolase/(4S)-4-hydroxy-2-oxoglutarate aldolase
VLARGIAMLPGVASPSEIEVNLERGLRLLKFFPAEASGGTGFLRAVHGPFPSVQFVPSGGVTARNMADYLAQPNVAAVGGTWIAPTERLAAGDINAIERAARDAAESVRKTRPDSRPSG